MSFRDWFRDIRTLGSGPARHKPEYYKVSDYDWFIEQTIIDGVPQDRYRVQLSSSSRNYTYPEYRSFEEAKKAYDELSKPRPVYTYKRVHP